MTKHSTFLVVSLLALISSSTTIYDCTSISGLVLVSGRLLRSNEKKREMSDEESNAEKDEKETSQAPKQKKSRTAELVEENDDDENDNSGAGGCLFASSSSSAFSITPNRGTARIGGSASTVQTAEAVDLLAVDRLDADQFQEIFSEGAAAKSDDSEESVKNVTVGTQQLFRISESIVNDPFVQYPENLVGKIGALTGIHKDGCDGAYMNDPTGACERCNTYEELGYTRDYESGVLDDEYEAALENLKRKKQERLASLRIEANTDEGEGGVDALHPDTARLSNRVWVPEQNHAGNMTEFADIHAAQENSSNQQAEVDENQGEEDENEDNNTPGDKTIFASLASFASFASFMRDFELQYRETMNSEQRSRTPNSADKPSREAEFVQRERDIEAEFKQYRENVDDKFNELQAAIAHPYESFERCMCTKCDCNKQYTEGDYVKIFDLYGNKASAQGGDTTSLLHLEPVVVVGGNGEVTGDCFGNAEFLNHAFLAHWGMGIDGREERMQRYYSVDDTTGTPVNQKYSFRRNRRSAVKNRRSGVL